MVSGDANRDSSASNFDGISSMTRKRFSRDQTLVNKPCSKFSLEAKRVAKHAVGSRRVADSRSGLWINASIIAASADFCVCPFDFSSENPSAVSDLAVLPMKWSE